MAFVALVALLVAGCGGRRGPDGFRPSAVAVLERPVEVYRELGFITGGPRFPAVGRIATLAGPADSTYVLLGISIPVTALRFQRDGAEFVAEHRTDLLFMDGDSVAMQRHTTRGQVRLPTFEETNRTDRTVVVQDIVAVAPGAYRLRAEVGDPNTSRGFVLNDTITVPAYGASASTLGSPLLVSAAQNRRRRDTAPSFTVNPTNTLPFGTTDAHLYLESYGQSGAVTVTVATAAGAVVWDTTMVLGDSAPLRSATVALPADLPPGRLWVEVAAAGSPAVRTPLLFTVTDQWIVADLEDLLYFLRFIAHEDEIESLRSGTPAERREAWDIFWTRRDPRPIRGINLFQDEFFERVRYATAAFREGGRPGWHAARAEVYIVLGRPDYIVERQVGRPDITGRPNAEEWFYSDVPGGSIRLLFHDPHGFGRLELEPSSAATFRIVAGRLKPQPPRN